VGLTRSSEPTWRLLPTSALSRLLIRPHSSSSMERRNFKIKADA
jgi:hypothetical protein